MCDHTDDISKNVLRLHHYYYNVHVRRNVQKKNKNYLKKKKK